MMNDYSYDNFKVATIYILANRVYSFIMLYCIYIFIVNTRMLTT